MKSIIIHIPYHLTNTIYGELFFQENKNSLPLIIFSHGYNSSYRECINTINALCGHGFAVLGFDFIGGSSITKSGGSPLEMSVATEMENLNAVIDYIKSKPFDNINTDKIFLLGESQGGVVSALVAATRNDINKIALYYPAFCLLEDGKALFQGLSDVPDKRDFMGLVIGKKYYEDIWDWDLYEMAAKYKGDVLILHGTKDSLVPYASSEKAASMYEKARLIPVEGADHGYQGEEVAFAAKHVAEFLRFHIIG